MYLYCIFETRKDGASGRTIWTYWAYHRQEELYWILAFERKKYFQGSLECCEENQVQIKAGWFEVGGGVGRGNHESALSNDLNWRCIYRATIQANSGNRWHRYLHRNIHTSAPTPTQENCNWPWRAAVVVSAPGCSHLCWAPNLSVQPVATWRNCSWAMEDSIHSPSTKDSHSGWTGGLSANLSDSSVVTNFREGYRETVSVSGDAGSTNRTIFRGSVCIPPCWIVHGCHHCAPAYCFNYAPGESICYCHCLGF